MRSFISFILLSLIFVLMLWTVGIASMAWYARGPAPLTASLEQSGIYTDTAEVITGMMSQLLPPDPRLQPIIEALDAEITPAYLSFKAKHIIAKGFKYALHQTEELPSFSLSDLAQKLEERTSLFKTLPKEARETLDKRYTLPQEQGEVLRSSYFFFRLALWILAALCGFLFLLLLPLRKTWPERIALVGKGMFFPGFLGLLFAGAMAVLIFFIPWLPLTGFPPALVVRYMADSLLLLIADITGNLYLIQALLFAALWIIGITLWKGRTMQWWWKAIHITAVLLFLGVSFVGASPYKATASETKHIDTTAGFSLRYQSDWIPFTTANIPNLNAQFYPKSAGFPRFPFYGVSIFIEDLGEKPLTPMQYTDKSISEVKQFLTQVKIVERSDADLAGLPRVLQKGGPG